MPAARMPTPSSTRPTCSRLTRTRLNEKVGTRLTIRPPTSSSHSAFSTGERKNSLSTSWLRIRNSRLTPAPAGDGMPVKKLPVHCGLRSEEHTSELQSLMRISYAVFCLKKKNKNKMNNIHLTYEHTQHHNNM